MLSLYAGLLAFYTAILALLSRFDCSSANSSISLKNSIHAGCIDGWHQIEENASYYLVICILSLLPTNTCGSFSCSSRFSKGGKSGNLEMGSIGHGDLFYIFEYRYWFLD
mmetsp:Transcript_8894/g.18442  ORF Transcript_8894/g.18442 Transcript_8894/m.18442 type:complete len:110 (+) Transcript_8894:42-371(+)